MNSMAIPKESLKGSIVAFEGKSDMILTQLRLLPTSPQLLILPSLESYVAASDPGCAFDARHFVRKVHKALQARHDTARNFLDGSTTDHKRLVFMNGGTPGAQALCIKEIMKHETQGDQAEAEAVFDDIVKDGLSGLEKHIADQEKEAQMPFSYAHILVDNENTEEDPITKAMRAADALDRQTADLQPPNGLGLNVVTRPRSSSLPLYGFFDELEDSTPFYVFGVRPNDEDNSSTIDETAESQSLPSAPVTPLAKSRTTPLSTRRPSAAFSSPSVYTVSCAGEAYDPNVIDDHQAEPLVASPMSDAFSIRSSDQVVYGEASVLDMRLSNGKRSLSRVKSLDRIFPATPKFRDLGIPTQSWLDETDIPRAALRHPQSAIFPSEDKHWRLSRSSVIEKPRFVVVKSRMPSVKMKPVPSEKKRKRSREIRDSINPNYVDRGTDAQQSLIDTTTTFQPLLPPLEDLVVFFKDESSDILLETAIFAFKNHRYPLLSYSPSASDAEVMDRSLPSTPIQSPQKDVDDVAINPEDPSVTSSGADPSADEYDPFAYTQPAWQPSKPQRVSGDVIERPPTPAQTPPPTSTEFNEYKVREFNIGTNQTAVSVQNSLRSVLGEYFPPDTQGYHQFQFSLLPEFDELWKPIFRGSEPGNCQREDCGGPQILAIGSQNGVKREYSLAVTGRLEKVGRQSCEIAKTDRLDFRYLLASAMQAFTAQRLTHQTDNPFSNSYLLATLLIPHLETYLALHTEVRYLLLMYPPEHLATVLALQKLIGMEVMKVAQIVDSKSSEGSPFTHIHGASMTSKSESKATRPPFGPRTPSEVAVSKANYLLTSTASEQDIATFVSTVWNIKVKEPFKPAFEQGLEDSSQKRPAPLSLKKPAPADVPSPATTVSVPMTPGPSQASMSPAARAEAATSPASQHAPSVAGTIKTFRSAISKRSPMRPSTKSAPTVDEELLTTFDDESDDDVEERRLMPVFMQKSGLRKPNSRKALKFLGLA